MLILSIIQRYKSLYDVSTQQQVEINSREKPESPNILNEIKNSR